MSTGRKEAIRDTVKVWLFKAGLIRFKDPVAAGYEIGLRKGIRARERFEKSIAWANVPDDASEIGK